MSSHAFGSVLEVEPASKWAPRAPSPSHSRDAPDISQPAEFELKEHRKEQLPSVSPGSSGSARGINIDNSSDPERTSYPASPVNEAVDVVQSVTNPPMNKWRLLSACLINLGSGLNDSAPGPLIPYIEKEYDIGYAVVALIFVTNALGFITAAFCTHAIEARLGRSRGYALGVSVLAASYIAVVCKPPFPVIVVSYFFIGFGIAVPLAYNNVFCANLVNSTAALGALHGAYGIGGIVGPLIATTIASNDPRWTFFYFVPLGLSLFNICYSVWAFWGYEKDSSSQLQSNALELTPSRRENAPADGTKKQVLKQALKNRVTLLGALFIFAYQGAEVSISGWVVSFLISNRDADVSKIGYVTSGFWGGITLGRFLLSHPAQKMGKKLSVVLLVVGSIAFQLLVWLIPNIIGGAVSLAILGFLLGPIYPCAASVFSTLLPRSVQVSSLSFISAMGSSGGAFAPFFTGLIAQKVGTMVLHPISIGLYAVMISAWIGLPPIRKRSE